MFQNVFAHPPQPTDRVYQVNESTFADLPEFLHGRISFDGVNYYIEGSFPVSFLPDSFVWFDQDKDRVCLVPADEIITYSNELYRQRFSPAYEARIFDGSLESIATLPITHATRDHDGVCSVIGYSKSTTSKITADGHIILNAGDLCVSLGKFDNFASILLVIPQYSAEYNNSMIILE